MKVVDICCRWPGSAHDATIFANSVLSDKFEQGVFGTDSVILGDSAYGPQRYICKPLQNPVSPEEKRYQTAHIKTRNIAERTIGVLKKRFPCLAIGMFFNLAKLQDIVVSCCILHNMLICEKEIETPIEEDETQHQINIGQQLDAANVAHIQNFLIENFFEIL